MRRRPFILSILVVPALALAIEIHAAFAGEAVLQQSTVALSSAAQGPRWCMCAGVRVIKDGTGSGTVSSVPAGIDCGPTCMHGYPWHTPVALTATPAAGSTFTGWSAGCPGTGTCNVTAACGGAACTPTTVVATFTLTSQIPNTLSVSNHGTGWGTVVSTPAGIECGSTCSHEYPAGTSVSLSATPGYGSTFTGWSGACAGTATCNVTIGAPTGVAVTATFAAVPPHCLVPKVRGKALAAAERSIKSRDCSIGRIKHVASRTVAKGHVLSQKPKAGAKLTQNASVNLVVSQGGR